MATRPIEPSEVAPPSTATAEDRFVALARELAAHINAVTTQVEGGALTFDGGVAAIEDLVAQFPLRLHRLAEAVKAGTLPV